jgi:O-antigen/teichoic acid export membrane protein
MHAGLATTTAVGSPPFTGQPSHKVNPAEMLIRQTLLYLPSQLLGPSIQLLAMVLWTHVLTPSDVGAITLFMATRDILISLTASWWTNYTARYVADRVNRADHDATERVVVVVGAVLRTAALFVYFRFTGYTMTAALYAVCACQVVTEALTLHGTIRFRALAHIGQYTILSNVGPLLGVPLGLALTLVLADKMLAILAGYAIGQFVAIVVTRSISPYIHTSGAFETAAASRALRYSGPLVYGAVCSWISANFIRFVLEKQGGLQAVGVFSPGWTVGIRIIEVVSLFVTSAGFPLALARLRDEGKAAALDQLGRNAILLLALMLPTSVGLAMIGPHLAGMLFKHDFAAMAAALIPIASAYGLARCFRLHFSDQSFLVFEQSHRQLVLASFDAVMSVGLCSVGLLLGGIVGAAMGILAAGTFSLMASFGLAWRLLGLRMPVVQSLKILAATAVMGALSFALPAPMTVALMAFFVATCGAVYGLALAILFRGELLEIMPASLRGRLAYKAHER